MEIHQIVFGIQNKTHTHTEMQQPSLKPINVVPGGRTRGGYIRIRGGRATSYMTAPIKQHKVIITPILPVVSPSPRTPQGAPLFSPCSFFSLIHPSDL